MAGVKPRSAATQERRRKILEAALERFTSLGFAATTIEEIRERSGASTGSIYHHFASKEQLAAALYVEGLRDYQEGLVRELRRCRTARAGIRTIVDHHLRWVFAHPDWARFIFYMREPASVAATEGILREMNQRFFGQVAAWMRPHAERGDLPVLPEDLYVAILIGPSQKFERDWLAGRTRSDPSQVRRVLADAAWNSLRGRGEE